MDDFAFLGDAPTRNAQAFQQQPGASSSHAAAGASRPGIRIPTFSEVHAAEQSTGNALNSLFRPKGLLSAQQQHGAALQPPLFTAGPSPQQATGAAAGAAGPSGHQAPHVNQPPYQQQHHQQQQQAGAAAAAAAAAGPRPYAVHAAPQPHHFNPAPQQPAMRYQQPQPQPLAGLLHGPTALFDPGPIAQQGSAPLPGMGAAPLPASNAIVVSQRQTGNPVLKHIRNVRWVFGDIGPDYLLGANACALFLSLRYHLLHPNYILYRIKELGRAYGLRIVLVQVDVEDVVKPLADITKAAALNDCTLICAWSAEEAGRYLETYKAYENKPATGIQERVDADYTSRLAAALTAVRAVNRTDALALGAQFGTLAEVMGASKQALSAVPGVGPVKVNHLWDAFNVPFKKQHVQPILAGAPAAAPQQQQQQQQQQQGALGAQQQQQQQGPSHEHKVADTQEQGGVHGLPANGEPATRADAAASARAGSGHADGGGQSDEVLIADQAAEPAWGDADVEDGEEGEGEEQDEAGEPEGDADDLVHRASQMIFQMQAGAMALGAVESEDEGSGAGADDENWEHEDI